MKQKLGFRLTKIILQSVFTILDIYSENQKTVEIIAIQS